MQILGWLGELGELDELGELAGLAALAGLVALAELAGLAALVAKLAGLAGVAGLAGCAGWAGWAGWASCYANFFMLCNFVVVTLVCKFLAVMQISSCYGFWAITPTQPNHALSSFPALCVFLSCVSSSLPSASFPGI